MTRLWLGLLLGSCFFPVVSGAADELTPPSGDGAILPKDTRVETLWNAGEFTEGVAVAPDGMIYFSDITNGDKPGRILRFDPQTKETSVFCADSGQSNGLMFDRDGRLFASCGANHGQRALCRFTPEGEMVVVVDRYKGKQLNSPNDLVIHPNGSIYFTDPRYVGDEPVELDHMSIFRYEPRSRTLKRMTSDITKPNGVVLSPDKKTLYVAETDNGTADISKADNPNLKKRMTLNAFDIRSDGTLGERQVLVDFGDQLGVDGMTVDQQGHIYAAVRSPDHFGIRVYTPRGEEKAYIPTPDLPTNCCFGLGDEATMLYITAGTGLYRIPLNIPGYHPATSP